MGSTEVASEPKDVKNVKEPKEGNANEPSWWKERQLLNI
jgi:hypothetical protein